jgi:hypothetical protein
MALFLAKAINIIMLFKAKLDLWTLSPPSLPSPTGEGVEQSFPPWGKQERG